MALKNPHSKKLLPLSRFARNRTLVTGAWLWAIFSLMSWKQPEIWLYPGAFYQQATSYFELGRPDRAFQLLQRALRYDPNNPAYLVTQGYLALQLNRLDDAEENFRHSLRLRPEDNEARLGLGQVLANRSQWLGALDVLAECNKAGLTADQKLRRGKIYLQLRVNHLALADLEDALAQGADNPKIVEEAWRVADSREEWRPQVELWKHLSQRTKDPETRRRAMSRQAEALYGQGHAGEALAVYEQIPGEGNLRVRAQLALQLKQEEKASGLLRALHEKDANDPWVEREFAFVLHRLGKTAEASRLYQELIASSPNEQDTRARYAWLLNLESRYKEAWQVVAGLRGWRTDADLLRLRAKTAFWAGETVEAFEAYQLLAKTDRQDPKMQSELAVILTRMLKLEAAEGLYRRLIDEGAADDGVRTQYVWLLNTQGRYQEAWDIVRHMKATAGAGAAEQQQLEELQARTALWARQWRQAADGLEILARERSTDPALWRSLGESYRQAMNEAEALRVWQRYLELKPDDDEARLWLARSLARSENPASAGREYRRLLKGKATPEVVGEAARWFESQGQLRDAITQYINAMRASPQPEPEFYLRLARLHRWTQQPREAVGWYETYLAASHAAVDSGQNLEVRAEYTSSLLDVGRATAAFGEVRSLLASDPYNSDWLLLAARAASERGQPEAAVSYLERLSDERQLGPEERIWLAGQYRSAEQPRRALALLEESLATGGPLNPKDLEALADLRAELGEPRKALPLYEELLKKENDTELYLKVARVAGSIGPPELAADSFRTYLTAHPQKWDAQLSAARFFASAGQFPEALLHYEPYIANKGSEGLGLELAEVYLGSGRFEEGERYSRQALSEDPADPRARLALGQALHLRGRGDEAEKLLREVEAESPNDPETILWLGRVEMARNRHLAAYQMVGRAIELGGKQPDYWMTRGDAARQRGDYSRSMAAYLDAQKAGENPATFEAAQEKLTEETRPSVGGLLSLSGDSHGLRTQQAGAVWNFRPALLVPLSLQATRGEVSQRETSFSRSTVQLSSGDVYIKPQFTLDMAGGWERYGGGTSALTGRFGGRYLFSGGSEVGLHVSRESLWSGYDRRDPRNFNRIRDLSGIDPNFTLTGIRGSWTNVSRKNKKVQLDLGFDNYQDGNRRSYLYTHYQIPLQDSYGNWTVLRPDFYIESYRTDTPFYFSPRRYMTGGIMYHTIRKFADWTVEAEINPRVVAYQDVFGLGAHAVFDVRKKVGSVEIGGGSFFAIEQRTGYKQWRISGGVTIPLGGR